MGQRVKRDASRAEAAKKHGVATIQAYQPEIAAMNRLAAFARVAGVVTVSMFVVLVTRSPSVAVEAAPSVESKAEVRNDVASSYLPAQFFAEEKAARSSELPPQF